MSAKKRLPQQSQASDKEQGKQLEKSAKLAPKWPDVSSSGRGSSASADDEVFPSKIPKMARHNVEVTVDRTAAEDQTKVEGSSLADASNSSFGSDEVFDGQETPLDENSWLQVAKTTSEATSASRPTSTVEERQQPLADKPPPAPSKKRLAANKEMLPRMKRAPMTYSEQHRQRIAAAGQAPNDTRRNPRPAPSPIDSMDSSGYSSASSKYSQSARSTGLSLSVCSDNTSLDWDEEFEQSSLRQTGFSPSLQASLARRKNQARSALEDRSWQSFSSDMTDDDYWSEHRDSPDGDGWRSKLSDQPGGRTRHF